MSVGVGAQPHSITNDTVSQLHLGIGVLVVGRADYGAQAHALEEGQEQPAASWDAQLVHCTLAQPVQQAALHHKCSARLGQLGVEDGSTMPVKRLAKRCSSPLQDGPKEGVYCQLQHQGLKESQCKEVIV